MYGAGRGQNNSRYQDYESHHYQVRTANAHSQKASFHMVDVRSLVVKGVRFVEMQDDTLQGNAEYLKVQGMVAGGNAGNDAWYVSCVVSVLASQTRLQGLSGRCGTLWPVEEPSYNKRH